MSLEPIIRATTHRSKLAGFLSELRAQRGHHSAEFNRYQEIR